MAHVSLRCVNRESTLPPGRIVETGDRGEVFVHRGTGARDARSIVLLHGLAVNAALNWSSVFGALAQSFDVVAPDLRDHGSTPGTGAGFTLEDAADDVSALIDALALPPSIVVGYSMGGAIAQLLCKRRPDLVRALVLCATGPRFRAARRDQVLFSVVPATSVAAHAVPHPIACLAFRCIARRFLDGARMDGLDAHVAGLDVLHMLSACAALAEFDSRDWIASLDVPAAVLVHLRDQLVAPALQFELARALPDAVIHPVDGDHFAIAKHPRNFVSTLMRAIHQVSRSIDQSDTQAVAARRSA
jgi:pimeloyl-ACP methyl ester carboxylesterase